MTYRATADTAEDTDPVFAAFLGFLEHQMERRPDLLSVVTRADRDDAARILKGVRSDPDAELGDDFEIPGASSSKRPPSRVRKRPRRAKKK